MYDQSTLTNLGRAFALASSLFATSALAADRGGCRVMQTGMASWYGKELKGHKMANGKRFNPAAPTVAHPFLPKGTPVKIERATKEGEVFIVSATVTDRGPYAKGRIVDVSKGLAEQLHMVRAGTARVSVLKCP